MKLESLILAAATSKTVSTTQKRAIEKVIDQLSRGELRVASKTDSGWVTHAWIKQAILLYFQIRNINLIQAGSLTWLDKIPVRRFKAKDGVRSVPTSLVRVGAFVSPGAILMPSYVNIGAYVGRGTMIDTWATVGSCAQVGDAVHVSGGVGLGGVLEPLQANPVIIEDHVFLGSRVVVVEGVRVEEGAVIGAGVVLTQSTKIIDVRGPKEKVLKGVIPPKSIVIPGSVSKSFPAGDYQVPCALIIGTRSAATDQKTSLTQALRDFEIPV